MTRRLVFTYLIISLIGLAVLVIPLGTTFASRERDRLVFDIERDATVVASLSEDALEAGARPALGQLLDGYATGDGRIVVVDTDGLSVYDTDTTETRDFSSRPEIIEALDGRRNDGIRRSETLDLDLIYVAVPVASGGAVHGAVRITYPTSTLDARIAGTWWRLGGLSSVVLVTVAAVGWILARGVTQPVRAVRDTAIALAGGDLTQRAPTDIGAPELRDLALTFNQTAATLEELVAAQQAFVADASHQLRTPLTALRLRLENLEGALDGKDRLGLMAAINETDRLARIVDGLLTLARTDDQPHELHAVELAPLIDDRLALWAPQADSKGISIVTGDTSGSVLAIPGALEQILDNLISNAVNASPPNTTITITTDRSATHHTIHVIDQGPGLPLDDRQRAFGRFWRAPGNRSKGSGLGLAIVAELATASEGEAVLDVGPEGGLDAAIRLQIPGNGGVARPDPRGHGSTDDETLTLR